MIEWINIKLKETSVACPEQYDAFYNGKQVGYLRLRHGGFTVECPDASGETVFSASPEGDGCFANHERYEYLTKAKMAIANYINQPKEK